MTLESPLSRLVDLRQFRTDAAHAIIVYPAYAHAEEPLNHFGAVYAPGASIWLHEAMANIVCDAALDMHASHGWRLKLMDGLRTIDAQYAMHEAYTGKDKEGMLAPPGGGAHPKGMAVDMVPVDDNGDYIQMGTPFDGFSLASSRVSENIAPQARENRLVVERAMQRAALKRGLLLAPLRHEHWDYRFPENAADHWRVVESIGRCIGWPPMRKETQRHYEAHNDLASIWRDYLSGQLAALERVLGVTQPPSIDQAVYHGNYSALTEAEFRTRGVALSATMRDELKAS